MVFPLPISMDISFRQKIRKETVVLHDKLDWIELIEYTESQVECTFVFKCM